ncbi:2-iminobutanoate/2-iminopropanoate deaminase [Buchnera aphidicola (Eriosoma grossulariae)]|uniref:RidA family protein n=1 Tax=Buchnera aphidicola TaxID=9 RepID=UPI003A6C2A7E
MSSIYTINAPKPIGPYSQAITFKNFIITSGQIPIDIKSNTIPKNINEQTYITLKNIKSILIAANFNIKNIVKTTIYIVNMEEIDQINQTYETFFIKNNVSYFPSRTCIEVSALPQKVKIEIEAIAYKNDK